MGCPQVTAIPNHCASPRVRRSRSGASPGRGVKGATVAAIVLPALFALSCATVSADTFRVTPTFGIQETLTNNVNLSPSESRQGDLVTQLTPGFTINETGPRTSLVGTVAVPIVLYVKTGAENNTAYVQANLLGSVEAIEKFFFIEGAVNAAPQYFTPFGAQPQGLANATQNRYQSASYRVSPYIKGGTTGDVEYLVRDDNTWSTLSGAPLSVSNSYTNQVVANVARHNPQLGWVLEYNRSSVKFNSQQPLLTELGRLRLEHKPDPQLLLTVSGGYENEDYTLSKSNGPIYGVGAKWFPTERTNVEAWWEHRFFGASYLFNFAHRTPLSVWTVNASRNITSYPQQIGTLPAGVDVSSLVNQLFLSSIPDPAQRQAAVDQFISNRGLPTSLSSPVDLYTQQITLQTQANASVGLLGARNSIFLSAFYLRQQPITAAGNDVPGFVGALNDNTQVGTTVVWTHTLAPSLTFVASGTVSRTESNVPQDSLGFIGTSRQGYFTVGTTTSLSPNTSVSGGVRYQVQRVDQGTGYNEAAVLFGLSHTFR
jgi:uncharacterized protein (PEP-CTERM system associated)